MTGISTDLIHSADKLSRVSDVIPPINVTTTFKYNDDYNKLVTAKDSPKDEITGNHIYSRLSHPNSETAEKLLESILDGNVVIYNSGLAAFFAALTYFNPKTIAIGRGYHGCHGIANLFTRIKGLKQIALEDDFSMLDKGDLVCLETPVNPDGKVFDIQHYAAKAHERGAFLLVDSTFAPPPLQHPFEWGADIIMHSATKYLGGHSDLLAGCLVTKDINVKNQLVEDRIYLGTNIGNLESYLLIRSLRTYELRLLQQSKNADEIVKFLVSNKHKYPHLAQVYHGSLQSEDYVKRQLPNGGSPVLSIDVDCEEYAKRLPSKLKYFHHATSLGGVESLIEWRALSDPTVHPTLLRISVGIENIEDLKSDLDQAFSSDI
ncbi:Piso0_005111 [Millerozyma farinosa CBS 7064]|uniref:Piso0_005111 protein n=1 Tax=Pichia sorbitophila (strain ATCC MYA-4447 / BCRC 22081 / CBS 7064 / NBRC 10061 / NRRL Y-12695) TaxID=559304 RepID=G8Y492_PICSO|nr:Piso0_005111 [Millerozyma farinosa CBS 7064]